MTQGGHLEGVPQLKQALETDENLCRATLACMATRDVYRVTEQSAKVCVCVCVCARAGMYKR